jgi:hypothetical protein
VVSITDEDNKGGHLVTNPEPEEGYKVEEGDLALAMVAQSRKMVEVQESVRMAISELEANLLKGQMVLDKKQQILEHKVLAGPEDEKVSHEAMPEDRDRARKAGSQAIVPAACFVSRRGQGLSTGLASMRDKDGAKLGKTGQIHHRN